MKSPSSAYHWASGVAITMLVASLAMAEPDKGSPPKCGGKDCAAAFPPGPPSDALKQKQKAASVATSKVNQHAAEVKQATGGDDGGGDGGLKAKDALTKAKLDKNKLAPPPPGAAGASKALPNTQLPKTQSPRDPANRG